MKRITPGEGQKFFPSFFLIPSLFLLAGAIAFGPIPFQGLAQGAEKEKLARFDRLAEEATLLNKRGQADKVINLLEPLKDNPKNDSALFFNELGVAYRQQGRLSESIQAYQSALSRSPENPVIMKNLGDAFVRNREYPRAIEQYQKILQTNPRFHQAHYGLGVALYQTQKYQEALEAFDTVLKLNSRDERAKNFREATLKKLKGKK
jgi:tetratricopeptide (TPR) repeat protein